jgi:hypothetical protein
MAYNRSKSKTSRRVKRAKTNNKRKQTFRKSRRVNRGGKGAQKRSNEDDAPQYVEDDEPPYVEDDAPQHDSLEVKALQNNEKDNYDPDSKERIELEKTKDKKNALKRVASIKSNMYLAPDGAGVVMNQTKRIKINKMQNLLTDELDAESEGEGEGGGGGGGD